MDLKAAESKCLPGGQGGDSSGSGLPRGSPA